MHRKGRLAPSIRSKVESHLREKRFVESILPVSSWRVEMASFDIHKIVNPVVSGKDYQKGAQKNFYNVKAFVLHRDNYTCQSNRTCKHSAKLHVHHKVFKSKGGSDSPDTCHAALHAKDFELKARHSATKHATEVGIVKAKLKQVWDFEETFGYETKFKREQVLGLPKTHYFDAQAICCREDKKTMSSGLVYQKRHVPQGDYQQTTGKRSEKRIPVGKLFGLRKFDLIGTEKGMGFVKGKRSSGYCALMDIHNNTISLSVNVKQNTACISSRTTTLIQQTEAALPLGTKVPSFRAEKG